jgi:hypothetical protein
MLSAAEQAQIPPVLAHTNRPFDFFCSWREVFYSFSLHPEVNKRASEMTALGRPGKPTDVGPMIAALLGEENR